MSTFLGRWPAATRSTALVAFLFTLLFISQQVAGAVVTEEVRLDLPLALDGEVWAVEQVGNAVVVGGNFTQVQVSRDGPIVDQAAIYAYDIDSGRFLEDFRPVFSSADGVVEVRDLEASLDGQSVYVGGKFTGIDDGSDGRVRTRNRLALLDIDDGRLDRNFAQAGVDAKVLSIALGPNGYLYVGGNFLTVLDLAPGRPPIEQPVRGLARFDAATGAFDTGFRYESRDDIGREFDGVRTPGVVKVVFNPAQTRLFVAHRGAEFYDATNDRTFDSPGVARLVVNGDQHLATNFKLLHPDPADPIQEFYHLGQCSGRGVQIRDMDVANGYLVVVSQGADTGAMCDTATRFSNASGEHRPDWVARAFDSVFSVEIDGDDVYIGGHFRYLVNATAPSPYPGETIANGEIVSNIYIADPNVDPDFAADLVDPGYVFPAGQLGVLDAATGFADPAWTPVSDAFKGVLEITAVERGLLIGQDQSRINGFLIGRSGFFDEDPDAGDPDCSVSANVDGNPLVAWTNIGSVNTWNMAANGVYVASVDGTGDQYVDEGQAPDQTVNYELRYNRNGLAYTADCGSITLAPLTISCTVTLTGSADAQLSWNDEGWSRVSVFRNGSWVAQVDDGATYTEEAPSGASAYAIRAFVSGQRYDASCGSITVAAPTLDCAASAVGDQVTISWNDEGWSRVSVFRNGSWVAQVDVGTSYTELAPVGESLYELRAFDEGTRTDSVCTPEIMIEAPVLVCTKTVANGNAVLTWNDVGASSYQIRTDGSWTAESGAGATSYALLTADGNHEIRFRQNGVIVDVPCA